MIQSNFARYFCGSVLLTLLGVGFSTPAAAQNSDDAICPFGTDLFVRLEQNRDNKDSVKALGTLLWLDRGDAIWADHPFDPNGVKPHPRGISVNYRDGGYGYPEDKKTAKKIEKHIAAHRDARPPVIGGSGPVFPRPKAVPAAPPASAIAFAETTLQCHYDGSAKLDMVKRAERLRDRPACPLDWLWMVKNMGPAEKHARDSDRALASRQDDAIAVLQWKARGPEAFHRPGEDGRDSAAGIRSGVRSLMQMGENTLVQQDPEIVAALKDFDPSQPIPPVLQGPPDEAFQWAEDYLQCRFDQTAWQSGLNNRDETRAEQKAVRARKLESDVTAYRARLAWAEANKDKRGRWRRPASDTVPSNIAQIGVYFDVAICQNVQRHMEARETLSADEQAWGDWYAFYGKDDLCGFLPPSYASWLPQRQIQSDSVGGSSRGSSRGAGPAPTDWSQYKTPTETPRERSNRERYEENQRCSNPTATGC